MATTKVSTKLLETVGVAEGGTGAVSSSAARTSLGLVIGTNVLAPNGSAASLTNLPAGGASAAEAANIMINSFNIAAAGGFAYQNMVDGVVDEFEDETGVDTSTSTNESYNTASDYYTNEDPYALIAYGTGTTIGDMTMYGGIAAAFDGNTTHAVAAAATRVPSSSVDHFVGKSWAGGATKTITKFIAYPSSDIGFTNNASPYTIELRAHTSAPSAAGDGTLLYTTGAGSGTGPPTGNTTNVDVDSGITTTTAYAHHWLSMGHGVNGTITVAEVEFFEETAPINMTLFSNATTALAVPTDANIVIWQEDGASAITLNTDLKAYASRNGGTTYTQTTDKKIKVIMQSRFHCKFSRAVTRHLFKLEILPRP